MPRPHWPAVGYTIVSGAAGGTWGRPGPLARLRVGSSLLGRSGRATAAGCGGPAGRGPACGAAATPAEAELELPR